MQRYRLAFATAKRGAWLGGILASWKALVSKSCRPASSLVGSLPLTSILQLPGQMQTRCCKVAGRGESMAPHSILDIWARWSKQMHLSCRQAAHQRLHAPRRGSSEVRCRGRPSAVRDPCCLQVIIQQASGIASLDQLSAFLSSTRIDVQLVSPAFLLQHSLLQCCTWASSCPCCLLSPSHSPTSALAAAAASELSCVPGAMH